MVVRILASLSQIADVKLRQIVGDNIRGFRTNLGWSQEKLGVRSGLHYNYIGCVERGEKGISIDNLEKIAIAMKVDIIKFFVEHSHQAISEKK